MSILFTSTARLSLVLSMALGLAACGDDAAGDGGAPSDDGGSSDASQAVQDACDPVSRILADSLRAQDCGDNDRLFQTGCERQGAKAEAAGCLAEFEAEQACLAEQLTADACTCDGTSFSCDMPCIDESFARRQCVEEG